MNFNDADVYGLSNHHLVTWQKWQLHEGVIADLEHLFSDAKEAGFTMGIASAHRSFDRQCSIWNAKVEGLRPTLDDREQQLNLQALPPGERVLKILRWSALPGSSRHHWGTDFDIYDAGAVEQNSYKLKLTRAETLPGGVFAGMYKWLDSYLERRDCPFYRPYNIDRGGVSVEPWHLSHKATAQTFEQRFSLNQFQEVLESAQIGLLDEVLENLDSIYDRFIRVPA